jgi:hypothetical protein
VTPVVALAVVPPLVGGAGAPATAPVGSGSAAPAALPFTGSNTALMGEGAALLLITGLGMLAAARKRDLFSARR